MHTTPTRTTRTLSVLLPSVLLAFACSPPPPDPNPEATSQPLRPGPTPRPTITDAPDAVSAFEGEIISIPVHFTPPQGAEASSYFWSWAGPASEETTEGSGAISSPLVGEAFYMEPGEYSVTLSIRYDDNSGDVHTIDLVIENRPPTLTEISYEPQQPRVGVPVTFTSNASDYHVDPLLDRLSYAWEVIQEGETIDVYSTQVLSYVFDTAGRYTIRLTVLDNNNTHASHEISVDVGEQGQTALIRTDNPTPKEGDTVVFTAETDRDDLMYRWDVWDGNFIQGPQASLVFPDDGAYTITLTASDADGDVAQDSMTVQVANAPPTISIQPTEQTAYEGQEYTLTPTAADPGQRDTLTFELAAGPRGMTIDPSSGRISWTPSYAQSGATYPCTVSVFDEDGGDAQASWQVRALFLDDDGDGVPDTCETQYGLDPDDPCDGVHGQCGDETRADPDNDGVPSDEECRRGTNPMESDGLPVPELQRPVHRAVISAQDVVLSCFTIASLDEDMSYTFEVFANGNSSQDGFVDAVSGLETETAQVAFDPEFFEEDAVFGWRVRASDGESVSPWSLMRLFTVSDEDNAPSVPVLVHPEGVIGSSNPRFIIENSVEPEGQDIGYTFTVLSDDGRVVWQTTAPQGGGPRTFVDWPSEEMGLASFESYSWYAAAFDTAGNESEASAPVEFRVEPNASNLPPTALALQYPADNAVIFGAGSVRLVWGYAEDPNGDDGIEYILHLSDGRTGEAVEWSTIPQQERGMERAWWQDVELSVGEYRWSVEAFDGDFSFMSEARSFTVVNVDDYDAGNDVGGDVQEDGSPPPDVGQEDAAFDVPPDDVFDPSLDAGGGTTNRAPSQEAPSPPRVRTEFACAQAPLGATSSTHGLFFALLLGCLALRRRNHSPPFPKPTGTP